MHQVKKNKKNKKNKYKLTKCNRESLLNEKKPQKGSDGALRADILALSSVKDAAGLIHHERLL